MMSTDHPGVDCSGQVEKFQEKALMELQDYVQKTYPDDTYRYKRRSYFLHGDSLAFNVERFLFLKAILTRCLNIRK